MKTPTMRPGLSGQVLGSSVQGGSSRANSVESVADPLPCVEAMDYASGLRLLAVVLTDGACALLRAAESGLAPAEQLQLLHWVCGPGSGALSVRIGATHTTLLLPLPARISVQMRCTTSELPPIFIAQHSSVRLQDSNLHRRYFLPPNFMFLMCVAGAVAQLLAVGLSSGEVALYKLWSTKGGEPLRIISLADWGYEPEVTGSVADLQWSPDNRALAVSDPSYG